MFIRIAIAFAVLCMSGGGDWERVAPGIQISFPRDHAAHATFRTEWWYATGELKDAATGEWYGYQLTIFRRGLGASRPASRPHILAGHFAIVPFKGSPMLHAERMRRADGALAGFSESAMNVFVDDWEMVMNKGVMSLRASDADSGSAIDLLLKPAREPVLHGRNGYSQKGPDPGNASAYSSFTRLATRGTLQIRGRTCVVSGESWFDHEWGTSQLDAGVAGWDWFGLRLDDGSEWMFYGLRTPAGGYLKQSAGTFVDRDGVAHPLSNTDFVLTPFESWTSPATAAKYPIRWKIDVPRWNRTLEVSACVPAAELQTSATTGVTYWEGPVRVTGTTTGRGYMELTGYAGGLGGRF
jgi:predicted secreted hydrolase